MLRLMKSLLGLTSTRYELCVCKNDEGKGEISIQGGSEKLEHKHYVKSAFISFFLLEIRTGERSKKSKIKLAIYAN